MVSSNSKRVLKNTLSLYIRTAVLTVISLFTSRIVLNVLGMDDYGINNVVGGIVLMFSFITGTLANATQRYFSLDLANGNWNKINKTYSINLAIYLSFILFIFVVSETMGLWFVINKLNYDQARIAAVIVVFETSIFSFMINLFATPYIALLTADENLSIYSAVSVAEAFIKLIIVYLLSVISADKLILYAILNMIASISVNFFYFIYTKNKYPKLKFSFVRNKQEYIGVFSYQSWNMIGAVANVLKGQGINIVINLFFGTAINAARGVAMQVNIAISSFAQNFLKAINPQITKAYGREDHDRFNLLIFSASKMAFSLLFILSIPVIFDADYILNLWLMDVPDYAVVFVKFALVDAVIASFTDSIGTGVQAIGKIKAYQVAVGGTFLLNVPISYILLKMRNNPIVPFIVGIILSVIGAILRIACIKRIYDFRVWKYIKEVIIPIITASIIVTLIIDLIVKEAQSFLGLVSNIIVIMGITIAVIFILILNKTEREWIINIIKNKFNER